MSSGSVRSGSVGSGSVSSGSVCSGSVSSDSVRSGSVGSGYAAGCAAKATPRRQDLTSVGAVPLVRPSAQKHLGQSPYRGRSPLSSVQSTAGHSPRRTPGGRAEANTPGKNAPSMNDFECKLSASQEERLGAQRLRAQRLGAQRLGGAATRCAAATPPGVRRRLRLAGKA